MVFRNPRLTALTGAPALASVVRADLVENPKLDAAAVADFEAQVSSSSVCHGDQRQCGCLRRAPGGLDQGCATGWSGGSDVHVTGAGGPLACVTAFFGWNASYSQAFDPWIELVVLDGAADIEAAVGEGAWPPPDAARPQLRFTGSLPYQSWVGSELRSVSLLQPADSATNAQAQVTVTERLGDWVTLDPDEPPRLVGFIETLDPDAETLVGGPFEAAYIRRVHDVDPDLIDAEPGSEAAAGRTAQVLAEGAPRPSGRGGCGAVACQEARANFGRSTTTRPSRALDRARADPGRVAVWYLWALGGRHE